MNPAGEMKPACEMNPAGKMNPASTVPRFSTTPEVRAPTGSRRDSGASTPSTSSRRRRPTGTHVPPPPRRRRRIRGPTILRYDNLNDSGSEVEGDINENDDYEEDDEGEFEQFGLMRALVRELRVIEDEEDEEAGDPTEAEGEPTTSVSTAGGDRDLEEFSWQEDFATFRGEEEQFLREPGLAPEAGTQDPVELFILIWDQTIVQNIVSQTNNYARGVIEALAERGPGAISKNLDMWRETDVPEMYRYIAVLMFMALNPRGHIHEYWSTNILGMAGFRSLMSRNRFQMISRFLHFMDNDLLPNNVISYERKVAKILPLVDDLNAKFSHLYRPQRHLSLDESLLLWKGRLSWVQCIRTKAARFGIKTFEVTEAVTGYLLNLIIYAGKNSSRYQGPIHGFNTSTSKVILKLMDGYLDAGHCLVMDNWFNQLPITRYLKSRKTDVVGTLRRNRRHVPPAIKNANEWMPRGHRVSCHCGDISLTAWKDVKLVTTVSTFHGDQMVPGQRVGQDTEKPISVSEYNKYMGGVDLKDQKLSPYLLERKRGLKWYIKVQRRLLNVSILNAYIMYLKHPMFRVLSHRQFRYALAENLHKRFASPQIFRQLSRPDPALKSQLQEMTDGSQPCSCKHHDPTHTEPMPDKPSQHVRRRCVVCNAAGVRTRVITMCELCKVPLCIGSSCWKRHRLTAVSNDDE